MQSDSEKHYGSDLEGDEEEEGDEFASSLPPATTAGSECNHKHGLAVCVGLALPCPFGWLVACTWGSSD